MSRLAIFVEGLTEQLFLERLVQHIAGPRNIRFELRRASGAVTDRRRLRLLRSVEPDEGQAHYVMIVDCSNDELVNSRIREEYESLRQAGYGLIIALRDVYPQPRADIPSIRRRQLYGLRTVPIPVVGILAVMEIEAWFLAEHSHFRRLNVDACVDCEMIRGWFGFDPGVDDMSLRPAPAVDMSRIYFLAGTEYRKRRDLLVRTVNLLDMDEMYFNLAARCPDFAQLISAIEGFLFPPPV